MAKKIIRPLHSEADYDAALNEIERYFENEPKIGTPEADRFDLLALIIEDYERKRWPIEPPEPIDAIRYGMETGGYTQADLGRLLGSRQRIGHPDKEASSHDEDGLAAAPRVGHTGGGIDRTATIAREEVGGIGVSAGGNQCQLAPIEAPPLGRAHRYSSISSRRTPSPARALARACSIRRKKRGSFSSR
jgi:antitoxin component HigA of HigAB toxin-antitoxin module